MANYLMPSDGSAPVQPTENLGRDIMHVNDMYKVKIHNKSGTIAFTGFIPPDFSFSLASRWDSPYGGTTLNDLAQKFGSGGVKNAADIIQRGATLGGASSFHKLFTAKKWVGPDYLQINLPIFLDAYTDTKKEVVDNIIGLLSMCAPSEKGGILVPPGPIPINQLVDGAIATVQDTTGKTLQNPAQDEESFIVEIGNFFEMTPCVVDSVNANFDNIWEDRSGNPISVDFVLNISSYFAVTREDLLKWFSPKKETSTA